MLTPVTQAASPCVAALDSAIGNALGTGPRTLVTGNGSSAQNVADDPQWQRKTKVVCTIGPATCSREALFALADAGMNVARCVSAPLRAAAAHGCAPAAVGRAAPAPLPPGPGGSTTRAAAAHPWCTPAGGANAPSSAPGAPLRQRRLA